MLKALDTQTSGQAYVLDGVRPRLESRPTSIIELSEALALAHREGLAVVPWGGGQHQGLGNRLARYDAVLALDALSGVLAHEPADMTLTVLAGTPLAAVQDYLRPHGQFLPLEAENPELATVGGVLASALSGPLRLGYGTPRDFTLWVEGVRPDGTIVRGGAKVVKNVAGYDVPKLFVGGLGSVGVIGAVTLRVLPAPRVQRTLLLGFAHAASAASVMAELRSGKLHPSLLTLVHGDAAWGLPYEAAPWVLAVGADGTEEATRHQLERFEALGAGAATMRAFSGAASASVRQALMRPRAHGPVALKLAVLPSEVPEVADRLRALDAWGVFCEAGNGIVRASWAIAFEGWREAAHLAEARGGTWVLERCPGPWKADGLDVWGAPRGDRVLMRRLKATLDPAGVLNPGRFIGG